MWFSVHGTTGAAITLATGDYILGGSVAFVSHFVWDYLGESGLKDKFHATIIEATAFAMFLVGAYLFGNFWLASFGYIMGCLPDLIDKPRRLIFGKKEWFSCHNGPGLFQYKGKKLGYPVRYSLNDVQTALLNYGVSILWLGIAILTSLT
jgi:hypothetical protein